jgi:hypothetical protein
MILSEAVEAYIVHKRSLGMGFRGEAVRLRAFVRTVGDRDMRRVGPAPVRRFLEGTGPITSFWFAKYYTLNAFYRYALARGYRVEVPTPNQHSAEAGEISALHLFQRRHAAVDRCGRFAASIRMAA